MKERKVFGRGVAGLLVLLLAAGSLAWLAQAGVSEAGVSTAWIKRYSGPGIQEDQAKGIAVDGTGNVYVTGSSNGSGNWKLDYATVKYSPLGAQLWARRYNPYNLDDEAAAIAVDAQGNVIVTGTSKGPTTQSDYATIKYSPLGVILWVKRYNASWSGSIGSSDHATAMTVDGSGNVYVTGYSSGFNTNFDYVTIKYSPSGQQLWVKRYNGPLTGYIKSEDKPAAIAVDALGNVYVTGYSYGISNYKEYATVKYSPAGVQLWAKRYHGAINGDSSALALAVDKSGNVYVTGTSYGGQSTGDDYATVKYSSTGTQLWVKRYNGPGNSIDAATAVKLDSLGNVYVTGRSQGAAPNDQEYATIKYSPAGGQLWVKRYNLRTYMDDGATAMAVDAQNNIYVTGYSVGASTGYDYATIKYSPAGAQLWVIRSSGPSGTGTYSEDRPTAIKVVGQGNVYVTGHSYAISTGVDYLTIKYKQTP